MVIHSETRLRLPDLLKGVAVVLMVQVHLTELFASPDFYESLVGRISLFLGGPPAAPVFMAAMGYFIAKADGNPASLMLRGLKLIGLGFLLNIGLNAHLLVKIIQGTFTGIDPWTYIFGVDILFLAGLSLIFIALFQPVFKKHLIAWFGLLLVAASANHWLPTYSGDNSVIHFVQAYFFGEAHWSYFPLFPWLSYPLGGYLFYLVEKTPFFQHIKARAGLFWLVLSVILAASLMYGFRISTQLEAYYHHDVLFVLWTFAFVTWWLLSWQQMEKWIPENRVFRYLRFCGKNVTVFYIIQWLLIGNIATALYRSQSPLQWFIWLIIILIASSLLTKGYLIVRKKASCKL